MRTKILFTTLFLFLMLASACGARQPGQPEPSAPTPVATSPTGAQLGVSNQTGETALLWEGQPVLDDSQGSCQRLRLTGDNQAAVGPCDTEPSPVEFAAAGRPGGWAEIVSRFAPFEQTNGDEWIVFQGQGQLDGPAWQRAVSAWARLTTLELSSGRVSATGATVLSWWLGELPEQPGTCRQLVVMVQGYAYAHLTPCEGGQAELIGSGWLETSEWEPFDAWLYGRAPLYQANNYLDGRGTASMSAAEVADLAVWAETVYARLAPANSLPEGEAEAICPNPTEGTKLLRHAAQGYCLLYPADYVVVEGDDATVTLVLDSIMNHIDPRLGLTVEDAAGRTLEQVAEQVAADYALPDVASERTTTTIAGEEAVIFDQLPGQDLNRRVVLIHEERLYHFFFTPVDPSVAEVYERMETFYETITASFTLIPLEPGAPLQSEGE